MDEFLFYFLGFIIYIGFIFLTFKIYSRKNQIKNIFVLFFIYFYYSILAVYVLSWVDPNALFLEKLIMSSLYLIGGCLVLIEYYNRFVDCWEGHSSY